MRQKLGLIQALMHRPRLLILDEPTSGLDPLIRRELYDELRGVVAQGRTVLFSSHTLGEVDELCDEVIVLREGRLVEHEGVEALRGRAPRFVEIVLRDERVGPARSPREPPGSRSHRGPDHRPMVRPDRAAPRLAGRLPLAPRRDHRAARPGEPLPRLLQRGRSPDMINASLVRKTVRDHALLFGLTVAAVVLFEMFFVLAMRSMAYELKSFVSHRPFLQNLFRMLLSLDLRMGTSINILLAVGFVHPFLFATTWGFMIAIGTRITVGEIDRGTADLLFTLPLSRGTIYVSTTAVWIVAALILSACAWLGLWLGTLVFPPREPVSLARMGIATVNLVALCLAVGGVTSLVSCLVNRRGVAVGILVALLLFSFLINFLGVFIEFFRTIGFLGLLDYYRPVESARDGTWPVRNLLILSLVAIAGWTGGLFVFRRKDVPVA